MRSKRKVKVLGMREARRTYSWASLDRGHSPQQVRVGYRAPSGPGLGHCHHCPSRHRSLGSPPGSGCNTEPAILEPFGFRSFVQSPRFIGLGALHAPPHPQLLLPETLGQLQGLWIRERGSMAKCGLRVTCLEFTCSTCGMHIPWLGPGAQ